MGVYKGDRVSLIPYQSLAATVTDIYYVPLGGEGAGTSIVQGDVSNALLKGFNISTTGTTNIRILSFGVVDPNGSHQPIMQRDGNTGMFIGEINDSGHLYEEFETHVRDIQCFYIEIRNVHATTAYVFTGSLRWQPAP